MNGLRRRRTLPIVVGAVAVAAAVALSIGLTRGSSGGTQLSTVSHPPSVTQVPPSRLPTPPYVLSDPGQGKPGTHVVLTGRGFSDLAASYSGPDRRLDVYLHAYTSDGNDLLAVLGQVNVDSSGAFRLAAVIPATINVRQQGDEPIPPGRYLFVVGPTADILANSSFTVLR